MNELSIIFHKMGIDTKAVLDAAGTKWNFLKFFPGLVGGHCIGVDDTIFVIVSKRCTLSPGLIRSGEYPILKSTPHFSPDSRGARLSFPDYPVRTAD